MFLQQVNNLCNEIRVRCLVTRALNVAMFKCNIIAEQAKVNNPKARSYSVVCQLIKA